METEIKQIKQDLINEMNNLLDDDFSNIVNQNFINRLDEETADKTAFTIVQWFDVDDIYLKDNDEAITSIKKLFNNELKNINAFIDLWLKPLLENNFITNDDQVNYLKNFIAEQQEKDTDKSTGAISGIGRVYHSNLVQFSPSTRANNILSSVGLNNKTFVQIDSKTKEDFEKKLIMFVDSIPQFLINNFGGICQLVALIYKELSKVPEHKNELEESFMTLKRSHDKLGAGLEFMSKTIDCASHYKKVYEQPEIQKFIKGARGLTK